MSCEHCGKARRYMFRMVGPDDKPWWLCGFCWADGLRDPAPEEPDCIDAVNVPP